MWLLKSIALGCTLDERNDKVLLEVEAAKVHRRG
jgi:hypothetical protein